MVILAGLSSVVTLKKIGLSVCGLKSSCIISGAANQNIESVCAFIFAEKNKKNNRKNNHFRIHKVHNALSIVQVVKQRKMPMQITNVKF